MWHVAMHCSWQVVTLAGDAFHYQIRTLSNCHQLIIETGSTLTYHLSFMYRIYHHRNSQINRNRSSPYFLWKTTYYALGKVHIILKRWCFFYTSAVRYQPFVPKWKVVWFVDQRCPAFQLLELTSWHPPPLLQPHISSIWSYHSF